MPSENVDSRQNGLVITTYYNRNGVATGMTSGFAPANRYIINRISASTPNFRSKRPKWSLPMNDFSSYRVIRNSPRGVYVIVNSDKSRTEYSGCLDGVSVSDDYQDRGLDSAEVSAIDGIVRNKLLLSIKDQKINLAQAFAERKMTAETIANAATRIADCLVDLKRGNFASAASALGIKVSGRANARFKTQFRKAQPKAIAGGWLELQYGWKPLLNDIYGAAEQLALSTEKVVRGRASASHTVERQVSITTQDPNQGTKVETYMTRYTRKYVVYYSTRNEVLNSLSKMGITNPALVAWELVPYSFVVDWFLPIGNWLSSLDATLGLDFEKGSVTSFRRTIQYQEWRARNLSRTFDSVSGYANGSCTYVQVNRSKLTSFPGVAAPQFKNPISITHAANAIALVTQIVSNLKK